MRYDSEYTELFIHLCWRYGLDPYDTDGQELEKYCTEQEAKQLESIWYSEDGDR